MKPSRYNLIIESHNGSQLLFNSATAALAEIEPDKISLINCLLNGKQKPQTNEDKEIFGYLIEGGYLVADDIDELASLAKDSHRMRYDRSTCMLTIAPTLACNFRCDYCFENQRGGHMTRDTEQALLRFSDERISESEKLQITWFGGEPTLCLESIERLQEGFGEMAQRYKTDITPSSIITNGYLLDARNAMRLKKSGVLRAQVTIDGPQRVHDARRKLPGGKGTFDRIINNLIDASEIMGIVIRINVDRENQTHADEVLEILDRKSILGRVAVYFAQVNPADGFCADMNDKCLGTEDFSLIQVDLYHRLIAKGIYQIEYPALSPGGHCGADSENAFVVAPDGILFKCWEEISGDKKRSVGSVYNDKLENYQQDNLDKYLSYNPFDKADCVDCNILPICMGGCPYRGVLNNTKTRGTCISWKYNLKEMLALRHLCELMKEVRV